MHDTKQKHLPQWQLSILPIRHLFDRNFLSDMLTVFVSSLQIMRLSAEIPISFSDFKIFRALFYFVNGFDNEFSSAWIDENDAARGT